MKRVSPDPLCSLCNFSAFVGSRRNTLWNMMLLVGLWQQQFQQDVQLSQRDRAAGSVIILAKVEDWNWETIFYVHYRSIFNHCDIIGLKICRIRWKKRIIRAITVLRRSGSFKVIEVGTCWKPECDFLLVINNNWHPISYRFGDRSSLFKFWTPCVF